MVETIPLMAMVVVRYVPLGIRAVLRARTPGLFYSKVTLTICRDK
jgi:hypothetical protein